MIGKRRVRTIMATAFISVLGACAGPQAPESPVLNSEEIKALLLGNTSSGKAYIRGETRQVWTYFKDAERARVLVGDNRRETQWWVIEPGSLCFKANEDPILCYKNVRRTAEGFVAVATKGGATIRRAISNGDPKGIAKWEIAAEEDDTTLLTKKEIEKRIAGTRFRGELRGRGYVVTRFQSGGTASAEFYFTGALSGHSPDDRGTWSATDDEQVCYRFVFFGGGNRRCMSVSRSRGSIRFEHYWKRVDR